MTNAIVLECGESRFDMGGKHLPDSVHDTDQTISAGLVSRLRQYALRALTESGFPVETWRCEVYTMDGDLPLSERYYTVEFISIKGGMVGVQGIAIGRGGHPCLDQL